MDAGNIDIAVGYSATTKRWKNETWTWTDLVERLSAVHRTHETYAEYLAMSKTEQHRVKDIGGFVGGYLRSGRRSKRTVVHRQLITLDLDFAHAHFWSDFTLSFDFEAVLHSTHKHSPASPRYRLIIPIDRPVTPDEYLAISRRVAGDLGISLFDPTTFDISRLMYWPSASSDAPYEFEHQRGAWLSADEVLARYVDWTDTSAWPTVVRSLDDLRPKTGKQQDPTEKRGVIGAFCRTYTIPEAIEHFLSAYYTPAGEGRYTYVNGTTAAGLTVYEDKFAYSHHGSDPASEKLVNAFDLVRLHLFGHLDARDNENASFKAMEELARTDEQVRRTIARENIESARYDFEDDDDEEEDQDKGDDEQTSDDSTDADIPIPPITSQKTKKPKSKANTDAALEWSAGLEIDNRGKFLSSSTNLSLILAKDPAIKGAFSENRFDGKRYVTRDLPWRKVEAPELMKNVDYAGLRNYIEGVYGITGIAKIDDALALEFERNSFHPITEYLNGLTWDGVRRVDTLLIDYFGARDSLYTREAARKMVVGAVARVFEPGCKFDLVLTLAGYQGSGKSSFFKILGKQWFSDTFLTVQGKEALEQIQGAWIIEMAELAGLRKAEVEAVKHFISKQEDSFRPAYARVSETYKRQCVFVGTTNNKEFLRDPSGNRRFMPVSIDPELATKDTFTDLKDEVDQIWAEAVSLYRAGEPLYLSAKAEIQAKGQQLIHSEIDERQGLVEEFLAVELPEDWEDRGVYERRAYFMDMLTHRPGKLREHVCIAEIWVECLSRNKEDMTRLNTRDLNEIMRNMEGWEPVDNLVHFGPYGRQRAYRRKP